MRNSTDIVEKNFTNFSTLFSVTDEIGKEQVQTLKNKEDYTHITTKGFDQIKSPLANLNIEQKVTGI